jgi:hypothetical protein
VCARGRALACVRVRVSARVRVHACVRARVSVYVFVYSRARARAPAYVKRTRSHEVSFGDRFSSHEMDPLPMVLSRRLSSPTISPGVCIVHAACSTLHICHDVLRCMPYPARCTAQHRADPHRVPPGRSRLCPDGEWANSLASAPGLFFHTDVILASEFLCDLCCQPVSLNSICHCELSFLWFFFVSFLFFLGCLAKGTGTARQLSLRRVTQWRSPAGPSGRGNGIAMPVCPTTDGTFGIVAWNTSIFGCRAPWRFRVRQCRASVPVGRVLKHAGN